MNFPRADLSLLKELLRIAKPPFPARLLFSRASGRLPLVDEIRFKSSLPKSDFDAFLRAYREKKIAAERDRARRRRAFLFFG